MLFQGIRIAYVSTLSSHHCLYLFFFWWSLSVVVNLHGSWHPPFLLPFRCQKLAPCSSLVHPLLHHHVFPFSPTALAHLRFCNTRHLQRKSGHEAIWWDWSMISRQRPLTSCFPVHKLTPSSENPLIKNKTDKYCTIIFKLDKAMFVGLQKALFTCNNVT